MTYLEALRQRRDLEAKLFNEADAVWSEILAKVTKEPNARYLPIGRGTPGSMLRAAHDARDEAQARWESACSNYRKEDLRLFKRQQDEAAR